MTTTTENEKPTKYGDPNSIILFTKKYFTRNFKFRDLIE